MTKGQVETAERKALNELDKWLEVTGVIPQHTGYYYELQEVIKDAVHIGMQMALFGKTIYGIGVGGQKVSRGLAKGCEDSEWWGS